MLFHVLAMSQNRVIGKNNRLPWHFSSDLKFFKKLTLGQTVIMGRKTFESIGKPLPGRENFVITRQNFPPMPGVCFLSSVGAAIQQLSTEHGFIIGGGQIFEETLGVIQGVHLNLIYADYEGDTFYPGIPENFTEISRKKLQEDPQIDAIFYMKKDS